MKRLTVDDVMNYGPCSMYTQKAVTVLFAGRETITILDVFDMDIPNEDKIWVFSRSGVVSEMAQRLFACECAQSALHFFTEKYPNDNRPQAVIDASCLYAFAKTKKEKEAARRAACRAACWAADLTADWAACRAACWAACWADGWAACRAADSTERWAACWAADLTADWAACWAACRAARWAADPTARWAACRVADSTACWAACWAADSTERELQILFMMDVLVAIGELEPAKGEMK